MFFFWFGQVMRSVKKSVGLQTQQIKVAREAPCIYWTLLESSHEIQ